MASSRRRTISASLISRFSTWSMGEDASLAQRGTVTRNAIDEQHRLAMERRASLIGEVALAWNELHQAFGYVFSVLLKRPDHPLIGQALWTALTADSAQRDMLRAAIEWDSTPLRHQDKKRLLWTLKQAQGLAVFRNDAVHGLPTFTISASGVSTGFSPANPFGRWVRQHEYQLDPMHVLTVLQHDLRKLEAYVISGWRALHPIEIVDQPQAWPRRPSLRLLQLLSAEQTRIAKERPAPKPRRRPKSRRSKSKFR
jgi:hypothetical protein